MSTVVNVCRQQNGLWYVHHSVRKTQIPYKSQDDDRMTADD